MLQKKALELKIRREKRQEMIQESKIPLAALPERKLCQYEKIREDIIAKRKKLEAKWDTEWENKTYV